MSKRPTDGDEPAAKKRTSSRQITKDDASDDEAEERGSIQTATDDVMKSRRVIKARRTGTGAPPPTPVSGLPSAGPTSNPFAGVSLTGVLGGSGGFAAAAATDQAVTPVTPTEEVKPEVAKPEIPEATDGSEAGDGKSADEKRAEGGAAEPQAKPLGVPAFASFAGSAAPFAATAGAGQGFSFGSALTAQKAESGGGGTNGFGAAAASSAPFSFPSAGAGSGFGFKPTGGFPAVQSVFGSKDARTDANGAGSAEASAPDTGKPALANLPPETETVTGEEDEKTLWSGDGTLYEYDAGQWRERGKGELKINRGPGRPARFVMRHRAFLRLIMNASLWPEMKVTPMDGGKGVTFPVANAAGLDAASQQPKVQTFALRLKDASRLENLVDTINTNKKPQEASIEKTEN